MPRKTPEPPLQRAAERLGFNEAAARCRGKLGRHQDVRLRLRASMRPRPDAAENGAVHLDPARLLELQ